MIIASRYMMPSTDALEAAHLIDRLDRLARSGEQPQALNPAQWEALRFLSRANRFSRTPAGVADYLGSTRGTVSQTLIALEQKGYVARTPSLRDKRSIELSLTPLGEAAMTRDPLSELARDIDAATDGHPGGLLELLRATLRTAIARNEGRAFGVCRSCRYFRSDAEPGAAAPHRCALLREPLSEADAQSICVEHSSEAA